MQPLLHDVSVCLCVTTVSSAHVAELIQTRFEMWALVEPGNYILECGPNIPTEEGALGQF